LHPFAYDYVNKKKNNNVWDYDPPRRKQRKSRFPEFTQSDFTTLAKGGVKLAVVSIYPIEQGWFKPRLIGEGWFTDILARMISRLPVRFVNEVQADDFRYWDFFHEEYHFMNHEENRPHDVEGEVYRYRILKPGEDLGTLLAMENTIVVVMSVEGAQSFIPNNAEQIDNKTFNFAQTITNVEAMKKWVHPPFFVSLSHHFNNGLCGHARSFPGIAGLALNQEEGINDPINDMGEEMIDCLLGIGKYNHHERRILIDTKHMSVAARKTYYEKVRDLNKDKTDPDKIPIIVSHTAYSGNPELGADPEPKDTNDKYNESKTFNNWSINLFDDEIIEVFNSNGIMGLNFDERILSGKDVMEAYDDKFKKKEIKYRSYELQKFWAEQMLENVLAIVKVVVNSNDVAVEDKVKIWNMISIGTDFDGMINAEDAYITSEEFKDFRTMLENIMPDHADIENLLQGLTIEEALDKIMFENVRDFVQVYY
jgi:hypothetical protein